MDLLRIRRKKNWQKMKILRSLKFCKVKCHPKFEKWAEVKKGWQHMPSIYRFSSLVNSSVYVCTIRGRVRVEKVGAPSHAFGLGLSSASHARS